MMMMMIWREGLVGRVQPIKQKAFLGGFVAPLPATPDNNDNDIAVLSNDSKGKLGKIPVKKTCQKVIFSCSKSPNV